MDKLIDYVKKVFSDRLGFDDDWVDRLYHCWTIAVFILFALLLGTGQYVGEPISCIVGRIGSAPQHNDYSAAKDYLHRYCWITHTYYVKESIPNDKDREDYSRVAYYQWIPFLLALQAACLYLPRFAWSTLSERSGVQIKNIVTVALEAYSKSPADNRSTFNRVSNHFDVCLGMQAEHGVGWYARVRRACASKLCCFCGFHYGNYLFSTYMFCKSFYIGVIIFQMWCMNSFLVTGGQSWYMNEVFHHFTNRSTWNWEISGRFPRMTFCDAKIYSPGNIVPVTVQCVLPLNMFLDKLYLAIMLWYFALLTMSGFNILYWLKDILIEGNRYKFIKKFLHVISASNRRSSNSRPDTILPTTASISSTSLPKKTSRKPNARLLRHFVRNRLKIDGVFVLHIVSGNAGQLAVTDIIQPMWEHFLENNEVKEAI